MTYTPKCEYCGKFISIDPIKHKKTWDMKLIWTGGVLPEPSHDIFWHIDCNKNERKNEKIQRVLD